jgi:hypothetical protein
VGIPVGDAGDICLASRNFVWLWGDEAFAGWPIKPEIVMEGGNYVTDGIKPRIVSTNLSLLTIGCLGTRRPTISKQ